MVQCFCNSSFYLVFLHSSRVGISFPFWQ
uniref:Uncharacterized protein n=1 Tax=Rhizophora mucronata TaxID=61149 RepID=A0A2P2PJU3_RHIMU